MQRGMKGDRSESCAAAKIRRNGRRGCSGCEATIEVSCENRGHERTRWDSTPFARQRERRRQQQLKFCAVANVEFPMLSRSLKWFLFRSNKQAF